MVISEQYNKGSNVVQFHSSVYSYYKYFHILIFVYRLHEYKMRSMLKINIAKTSMTIHSRNSFFHTNTHLSKILPRRNKATAQKKNLKIKNNNTYPYISKRVFFPCDNNGKDENP